MSRAYIPVIHGAALDRPDELDTIKAAEGICAALQRQGYDSEVVALSLDLAGLKALAARRPACVFNLVEAFDGEAALSSLAPVMLEALGLAFTGARAVPYQQTLLKLPTKERLRAEGIPTADWWRLPDTPPAGTRVIVKTLSEHGSLGIDKDSVVDGAEAAAEINRREAQFGLPFFAEAYIDGREFNIALLETSDGVRVLPIGEIRFDTLPAGRPRIVDYESKWLEDTVGYDNTPRHFGLEQREPQLAARLGALALRCWQAFGLTGYARVDIRLDEAGAPWVLEVNTNPCLEPDAGFATTAGEAGLSYEQLIETIVAAATHAKGCPPFAPPDQARSFLEHDEKQWFANGSALAGVRGGALHCSFRNEVREADIAAVKAMVEATGKFTPVEVDVAGELVEERIAQGPASGYEFVVAEADGRLLGYACSGPATLTESGYDLYWIVVAPDMQGRGLGRLLLQRTERAMRDKGGRLLWADTSGQPLYAPTRAFYEGTGFRKAAELPDFYKDGDAKFIYVKDVRQ
jgi:D-alanine-D-alanine ligase-like ATP-grasp enzyme/ribosomal protein S18 acetylase RimI-like enzyme